MMRPPVCGMASCMSHPYCHKYNYIKIDEFWQTYLSIMFSGLNNVPVASLHFSSMFSTLATILEMIGFFRSVGINFLRSSSFPSATTNTEPSGRFSTVPVRSSLCALRFTKSRNITPCTRPVILHSRRFCIYKFCRH